jgi:hypothetical protein
MSTTHPNALRVVTDVEGVSAPITTASVMLSACADCGALLYDADAHRTACPRLKPERPEPITPDRYEWAKIIDLHRAKRVSYKPDAGVACACGSFAGAEFSHAQHVAAMIANYVEANR